jgi:O-antigen ligase
MTFEPSSFADQIVVIWLPWVLAASLDDYTVFKWRWKWITVERILCIWSMVILAFTLSRTGLIVGLGVVSFAFILKFIDPRMKDHRRKNGEIGQSSWVQKLHNYRFLLLILGIGVFLTLFYVIGRNSNYISHMWEYSPFTRGFSLRKYFNNIGFGARIAYWETAWQIFKSFPLLGVGLGNYTLYFSEYLPYQNLSVIPELLRHIVPAVNRTRVISVKHFLARILAEMGIVGFGIFMVFLIVLAAMAIFLWTSNDSEERFWGTAGFIGLIAFLGATFSFDSFAIPNPWILFGLITAAFNVYFQKMKMRRNHAG